jgi:hypothetical protein
MPAAGVGRLQDIMPPLPRTDPMLETSRRIFLACSLAAAGFVARRSDRRRIDDRSDRMRKAWKATAGRWSMSDEADDDNDIVNQLAYVRADPTQHDTPTLLTMIDAAIAEIMGLRTRPRLSEERDGGSDQRQ